MNFGDTHSAHTHAQTRLEVLREPHGRVRAWVACPCAWFDSPGHVGRNFRSFAQMPFACYRTCYDIIGLAPQVISCSCLRPAEGAERFPVATLVQSYYSVVVVPLGCAAGVPLCCDTTVLLCCGAALYMTAVLVSCWCGVPLA